MPSSLPDGERPAPVDASPRGSRRVLRSIRIRGRVRGGHGRRPRGRRLPRGDGVLPPRVQAGSPRDRSRRLARGIAPDFSSVRLAERYYDLFFPSSTTHTSSTLSPRFRTGVAAQPPGRVLRERARVQSCRTTCWKYLRSSTMSSSGFGTWWRGRIVGILLATVCPSPSTCFGSRRTQISRLGRSTSVHRPPVRGDPRRAARAGA